MRSFWKIHFINPPEVQDQVIRLVVYGLDNSDAKISKYLISVNRKKERKIIWYVIGSGREKKPPVKR